MYLSAEPVSHFSRVVGYSWAFIFRDATAEIISEKYDGHGVRGFLAQISIDLPTDPEKVADELTKKKRHLNFMH